MGGNSQLLHLKKSLEPNAQKYSPQLPEIPSSVLVLLGTDDQKTSFILTKRTFSVMTHKGQVSFPGGYREPEDQDLQETAKRESQEEIGLKPEDVEILGMLEPVNARGIFVAPWLGIMKLPYPFTLNPNEVEKLLYLPLERLLSEGLKTFDIEETGFRMQSKGILIGGDLVWGATARMLEQVRNYF
jgi:8-oxo-dGTP pyrophosphatase MutT (NUDIX family)